MKRITEGSRQQNQRRPLAVFGLMLALALVAMQGRAQSTQGAVVGSVTDSAGAVVPNATVTLTNTDEGVVRVTKTNGVGDYSFLNAKAGTYSVNVVAQGFDGWSANKVTVQVRQELRLDVKLAVGKVQQSVQVTGDQAAVIETDSPTVSGTFTSDDATNLPVNTRASFSGTSASNILGTLPGVQDDGSGISLQGALPYQTEVTIDGVTAKSATGGSFIGNAFPSTESIAEIRADGVLANAEFGDPAQIVVTTKGGSNTLHGSGFWYYQDSAFDAIAYTFPTTKTKPSVHGDTFGGSVGGPVVLPHLYNGHNKTFFYGAYEGWRHPAQSTISEKVPSTLMKQGDFSKYNAAGFTGLNNPFTGGTYGTSIPSTSLSQIALSTLKQFYPDPNVGDPTDYTDDGVANYIANVSASGHSDQFDLRGDQYFGSNQKFLIWGRFTWKNFPIGSPEILLVPSALNTSQSRVMKVDTNWSIHPNLINEGGFGFARLGYPVHMVGAVGDDVFGQALMDNLAAAGVDATTVARVTGPSGVAPILVADNGDNSIVVVQGANGKVDPALIDRNVALIRSAGMVLCQLELPMATINHAITLCAESGVPVMMDPAPAADLPDALWTKLSWFTPNESEAALYAGGAMSAEDATKHLLARGLQGVVLKRGADGAYVALASGEAKWVRPFRVEAIDTVAAGDCFNGAFAVAILEGNDPFTAARFASAAAAISVTRRGAQASMPTRADVDAFLAEHREAL